MGKKATDKWGTHDEAASSEVRIIFVSFESEIFAHFLSFKFQNNF